MKNTIHRFVAKSVWTSCWQSPSEKIEMKKVNVLLKHDVKLGGKKQAGN